MLSTWLKTGLFLLKKKYPVTFVKDGKADFIQRDYYSGDCSGRERLGPTLNMTKKKWEFIAKEKVGVSGCKVTERKETSGLGRFWLN